MPVCRILSAGVSIQLTLLLLDESAIRALNTGGVGSLNVCLSLVNLLWLPSVLGIYQNGDADITIRPKSSTATILLLIYFQEIQVESKD